MLATLPRILHETQGELSTHKRIPFYIKAPGEGATGRDADARGGGDLSLRYLGSVVDGEVATHRGPIFFFRNGKCFTKFSGTTRKIFNLARSSSALHKRDVLERFYRAYKYGTNPIFVAGDIRAVVHPVGEVDVPRAIGIAHDFRAGCDLVCVGGGVGAIGLGFNDNPDTRTFLYDLAE